MAGKVVGVWMNEELWRKGKERAWEERVSISAKIRQLLEEWLGEESGPAKSVRVVVGTPAKVGGRKASKPEPARAGSGGMYQKPVGWGGVHGLGEENE